MSPRNGIDNRHDAPEAVRAAQPHGSVAEPGATSPVVPAARTDQARWGPVWAGALVALPTFVVLQSLFFALGWLDLAVEGSGAATTRGVVTAVLGIIAFFVGGLMAAASSAWRGTTSGLLNGTLVWALTVVGLVLLAVAGGTSLLGPLTQLSGQPVVPDVPVQTAVATAQQTAGWVALALGVYWAAAALGGVAGARIWPKDRDRTGARG